MANDILKKRIVTTLESLHPGLDRSQLQALSELAVGNTISTASVASTAPESQILYWLSDRVFQEALSAGTNLIYLFSLQLGAIACLDDVSYLSGLVKDNRAKNDDRLKAARLLLDKGDFYSRHLIDIKISELSPLEGD